MFTDPVRTKLAPVAALVFNKGRVEFTEVDEQHHAIEMAAEGRETGGGTAKGTISLRVNALPDGVTELVTEANIDLTGRIMQVGRGMIQGVSHQLFKQFAANAKQQLEVSEEEGAAALAVAPQTPIRVLPLLLKTIAADVSRFFKRVFGRADG